MEALSKQELFELYEKLKSSLGSINLSKFDANSILMDEDVAKMLKCSHKTLRKRCKEGKISYFKLGARYYYIREILHLDLLKLNSDT